MSHFLIRWWERTTLIFDWTFWIFGRSMVTISLVHTSTSKNRSQAGPPSRNGIKRPVSCITSLSESQRHLEGRRLGSWGWHQILSCIGTFPCHFLFYSNSGCLLEHWEDLSVLPSTCICSVNSEQWAESWQLRKSLISNTVLLSWLITEIGYKLIRKYSCLGMSVKECWVSQLQCVSLFCKRFQSALL